MAGGDDVVAGDAGTAGEDETSLAMAWRHVTEGRERIARQEALIAELTRDGHHGMLPQANDVLAALRESQALAEEHLAREIAKAER